MLFEWKQKAVPILQSFVTAHAVVRIAAPLSLSSARASCLPLTSDIIQCCIVLRYTAHCFCRCMTEKFRKMGKYGNKCIDIMVLHYIHFRSVLMFLMPITKFRAFTGCCNLSVLSLKHHSQWHESCRKKEVHCGFIVVPSCEFFSRHNNCLLRHFIRQLSHVIVPCTCEDMSRALFTTFYFIRSHFAESLKFEASCSICWRLQQNYSWCVSSVTLTPLYGEVKALGTATL